MKKILVEKFFGYWSTSKFPNSVPFNRKVDVLKTKELFFLFFLNRLYCRERVPKLRKFWGRKAIFGVFGAVLEKFEGNGDASLFYFRFGGPVCANKFLARKLFVVSRGIKTDLAYFLRKLLRSENFKSICGANGDYVT